eukprot:7187873-Prymnesium_polylepis.3
MIQIPKIQHPGLTEGDGGGIEGRWPIEGAGRDAPSALWRVFAVAVHTVILGVLGMSERCPDR